MYHGPPEGRAKLRRSIFTGQSNKPTKSAATRRTSKSAKAKRTAASTDEEDEAGNISIIITTYEMIIRDRSFLSGFQWRYIVVDEGHRLKNMDSKHVFRVTTCPTLSNTYIFAGS
jgi:ATP-dependent DNA helicase